jgi:two-component system response regulator RegA
VDEGELIDALLDQAPPLPRVPQTPLGLHRIYWEHITRVYEQCGRNMTKAAQRLGMHRRTLQRFLSKRAPPPRAIPPMPGDRTPPAPSAGSAQQCV